MFLMKLKGNAKMILKKKLETKQSITVTESSITSYKQEGGIIKKIYRIKFLFIRDEILPTFDSGSFTSVSKSKVIGGGSSVPSWEHI